MNSWEGSACYPSGPNPAKRPLCPMPIFPIVSGPDFSCCWSFNLICQLWSYWEIPWPPKHLALLLSDMTYTYFIHQDLKILRCHCESAIQLISRLSGHLLTWGVPLSVSYHFALSYCSWGSQGKNTEVVCHSLLQWTTLCQTSPPWPARLGLPRRPGLVSLS